ncbi:hypothetical protein M3Y99_01556000 [Aphelenchoides fujianensis]|nr:hypothetical protein M3Y99_01556000 [Aphelenchoides fujianensis]
MRLPAILLPFFLLAVAAAAHRVPLFKQRTKTIDRHNPKFSSLLASARNEQRNARNDFYGETGEVVLGTQFFASFCGVFDYASQQFGYAAIN